MSSERQLASAVAGPQYGAVPLTLPAPRTPDPTTAPTLRWGILAPGGIARSFATALRARTGQHLQAVASRSLPRAEAFAREFGVTTAYGSYAELVADPDVDVVYVASPHSEHHAQALLAIEAGKGVLVEKAFTRNATEAAEVVAAARRAGVFAMEAMWTRFLPHIDVVRQCLEQGLLGEVCTVTADHGQQLYPDGPQRLADPALAGGALLDLGIYPMSFAHLVLGGFTSVTATGQVTDLGVDAQDAITVTSAAGGLGLLGTTMLANGPPPRPRSAGGRPGSRSTATSTARAPWSGSSAPRRHRARPVRVRGHPRTGCTSRRPRSRAGSAPASPNALDGAGRDGGHHAGDGRGPRRRSGSATPARVTPYPAPPPSALSRPIGGPDSPHDGGPGDKWERAGVRLRGRYDVRLGPWLLTRERPSPDVPAQTRVRVAILEPGRARPFLDDVGGCAAVCAACPRRLDGANGGTRTSTLSPGATAASCSSEYRTARATTVRAVADRDSRH